jgi:exonuclease SbcD
MKILHTSDWHLGQSLFNHKRYEECAAFLSWLGDLIEGEDIQALLVAGDIFDNSAPSHRAQELYYRFLCRIAQSSCRHVVIIAGNHDSPSFLNAPREVLRFLNVHVIGSIGEDCSEEVLLLKDLQGEPELIVCAVPYLRDRDIRRAEGGESREEKERKLLEGIKEHYHKVCEQAQKIREAIGRPLPIVAMGHLFAAGGKTVEGDGVRDLYVGSLAQVGVEVFPGCIDYLALGHLHSPQLLGGNECYRYSGAPLAMGFGEAGRPKSVCKVQWSEEGPQVKTIPVPVFQVLQRIEGSWTSIQEGIENLIREEAKVWVEIIYNGEEVLTDLRERIEEAVQGTSIDVLRIKNNRILEGEMFGINEEEMLGELDVEEVFSRCLDANKVPEDQRPGLWQSYRELIASLQEEDLLAE